ncbi:hypothetical protein RHS01_07509 [Rhizoctonia solani]|uniref:Retrotransposon gag domain-containing protein n=1 Tax=Rhizoctonia solani TaxID=456999 RepID=A0A8H7M367_9AGAM|nr:hypothetical protein RHS01_07509 [Rhizoctonia solani]
MATCSRPPSQACSLVNQGQLGPNFPPASPELGKVSLKQVIHLLWGLQSQVNRIERTLLEQNKINQEVCTNVKNISQAVNVVKDGLAQLQLPRGPHTPEDQKPPAVKETPWARPRPSLLARLTHSLGPSPHPAHRGPTLQPPHPIQPLSLLFLPFGTSSSHPGTSTSKIGLEARQWLTRMLAWVCLNQRQFPTDLEVLSFLLMNMTEAGGAWAHPHLDQLGSHRALIQTMDEFKVKFLATFGNPDATRAAEQKITSLTQTGTCAKYITKTLLGGPKTDCHKGEATLHPEELQDAALIIDNALCEERASHLQQGTKSGKTSSTPNQGASTSPQATKTSPLSSDPNYVLEEERNCHCAEGLCVECSKAGHKFAKCRTSWKATPKEDKGKAKETAKIGKDSKYQLGKE